MRWRCWQPSRCCRSSSFRFWSLCSVDFFGRPFTPSEWHVVGIVAIFALLPLAAGMAFRRLWPAQADRIEGPVLLVGDIVLRLAALALLETSWRAIWTLIGDGTVIAIAVFVVVGLVAGHLLEDRMPMDEPRSRLRRHRATRRSRFRLRRRTPPRRDCSARAILLYLLLNAIIGVPYTLWRQKQHADAAAAAAILAAQRKAVDDVRRAVRRRITRCRRPHPLPALLRRRRRRREAALTGAYAFGRVSFRARLRVTRDGRPAASAGAVGSPARRTRRSPRARQAARPAPAA